MPRYSISQITTVGQSFADDLDAYKDAGADGLLVEPHSIESLLATIRSVLRRDEQV